MKVGAWALRERILQGGWSNINKLNDQVASYPNLIRVWLGMDIPTLRVRLASH